MKLRDFIRMDDGRLGLIVANDLQGGVLRGHADVWFGGTEPDGLPDVEQLPVARMKRVDCPVGHLPKNP